MKPMPTQIRTICDVQKHSLWMLLFCMSACLWAGAQHRVQVKGRIDGFDPTATVYVSASDRLLPLTLTATGTFTADLLSPELPACVVFQTVSKNGKIDQVIPAVWIDENGAELQINPTARSFTASPRHPLQDISEKMESLQGKARIEYLQQHPNSLPGLYFIDKQKTEMSPTALQKMLSAADEPYQASIYGKRIEQYIAAKGRGPIKPGKPVMDFDLPDRQGNAQPVIGEAGRPKLIALFSSGCMYSIASIPLLEQLHQQSQGKLDIVTIWTDQSKDTWQQTYADKKAAIAWTDLWDAYGFADTYLDKTVSPTFYIVQPDGTLSDKIEGVGKAAVKKLRALVE
jgi:hypothetical protein